MRSRNLREELEEAAEQQRRLGVPLVRREDCRGEGREGRVWRAAQAGAARYNHGQGTAGHERLLQAPRPHREGRRFRGMAQHGRPRDDFIRRGAQDCRAHEGYDSPPRRREHRAAGHREGGQLQPVHRADCRRRSGQALSRRAHRPRPAQRPVIRGGEQHPLRQLRGAS